MLTTAVQELTYGERIEILRATKLRHTEEKLRAIGFLDMDDLINMLPPPESRKFVRIVSGSRLDIADALFKDFVPKSNYPSGGFFGAR